LQDTSQRHRTGIGVIGFQDDAFDAPAEAHLGHAQAQRQILAQPLDADKAHVWGGLNVEANQSRPYGAAGHTAWRAMCAENRFHHISA